MKYIQEPDWHYGWGLAGSPTEAKMAFTGDAGSAAMTEIYFPSPALFAEFAKFDKVLFDRGKAVWAKGTTPETGLLRPSPRMHMGIHGQNFVHGYTFEQRVAEALEPGGMAKWAEWVRGGTAAHPGGMGSMIPRPEVTNSDVRALLYYAFAHTSLAQAGLSPSIIDGEALPPTPPPDVTGPAGDGDRLADRAHAYRLAHWCKRRIPSGVAFAALFVDNEEVARDAVHPFALDYEFPPDADSGPHPFSVVAEDMAGNRTVVPDRHRRETLRADCRCVCRRACAIVEGESATLSWETSHAAVVTLNGEVVAADGVLSVAPLVTTTYDLVADGVSHQRVTLAVLPTRRGTPHQPTRHHLPGHRSRNHDPPAVRRPRSSCSRAPPGRSRSRSSRTRG